MYEVLTGTIGKARYSLNLVQIALDKSIEQMLGITYSGSDEEERLIEKAENLIRLSEVLKNYLRDFEELYKLRDL